MGFHGRLLAVVAVLLVFVHVVLAQPPRMFPCTGCCMRGCDAAHTNAVPLVLPTAGSNLGVMWSVQAPQASGVGCASSGSIAWCPYTNGTVQSVTFEGPSWKSSFVMLPYQVPLVTYV